MKKIKLIFGLMLVSIFAFSQAPNLINYQGVALNTSGTPIANQLINIRASIHDATIAGTVIFSEDRTVTTDATGLFDMQIGSPGAVNNFGTLNNVAWHSSLKFLQIKMDPTGGISFTDMGTQQLASVPYALNAKAASSLTPNAVVNLANIDASAATTNQVLQYNGTNWAPANVTTTPFSLPFTGTDANTTSFKVTNTLAAGTAIHGVASTNNANSVGVFGEATFSNTQGVGVSGKASTANAIAVKGTNIQGIAIQGTNSSNSNTVPAISGESTSFSGLGVEGIANGSNGSSIGVSGESANGTGVRGFSNVAGSVGVLGTSTGGVGVKAISFSGNALEVNGNLKISGGNTNPSQGAVLTSDASGNAVWKNYKVGFSASDINTALFLFYTKTTSVVHLLNEDFDYGNNYALNTTNSTSFGNSVFVAPITGVYHFDAAADIYSHPLLSDNDIKSVYLKLKITRVGSPIIYADISEFSAGVSSLNWMGQARLSKDIRLVNGDIVELVIQNDSEFVYALSIYSNTKPHFGCSLIFAE